MGIPSDFLDRANRILNLADFAGAAKPISIMEYLPKPPIESQHILRMMIRSPESQRYAIPNELSWLKPAIMKLDWNQRRYSLNNEFVYVTVRHGAVISLTDDEWHVDGFSMRVPHVPEQNYVCSTFETTEFVQKEWIIPADFDPMKHNIHKFFQSAIGAVKPVRFNEHEVVLIDPYMVHRRPPTTEKAPKCRTFWRLSFIPIEIEDDTCTPNPLLPTNFYGRRDVRESLSAYVISR